MPDQADDASRGKVVVCPHCPMRFEDTNPDVAWALLNNHTSKKHPQD